MVDGEVGEIMRRVRDLQLFIRRNFEIHTFIDNCLYLLKLQMLKRNYENHFMRNSLFRQIF